MKTDDPFAALDAPIDVLRELIPTTPSALALLESPLPADTNPARVYLASLRKSSRPAQTRALRIVHEILAPDVPIELFPWHRLKYQHVAAVKHELLERYADATINRVLCALRRVLTEARRLGLMSAEACLNARDVKSQKISPVAPIKARMVSPDELGAVRHAASRDGSPAARARNRSVCDSAAALVARRVEVSRARYEDYDETSAEILLRGKRGKTRRVPLSPSARTSLEAWLEHRGRAPGPLFCHVHASGRVYPEKGLSPQAINAILDRARDASGVARFTPHDLRRTGISELIDQTKDVFTVARLAGHEDPKTTMRYDLRPAQLGRAAVDARDLPAALPLSSSTDMESR